MEIDQVLDLGAQIADALDAAHAQHIIHRDIKPANLFLAKEDGTEIIKVIDFGICKSLCRKSEYRTLSKSYLGSPQYMSPEQINGVTVDQHALKDRVDFHDADYPYLFGFQDREGDGWRWAAADTAILLRYGGEPELALDIYVPPLTRYRFRRGVGIAASIGDCRLGAFRQDESERRLWKLGTGNCPLQEGSTVAVRLVSDNVVDARDGRQLAYIVHALGFVGPQTDEAGQAGQR